MKRIAALLLVCISSSAAAQSTLLAYCLGTPPPAGDPRLEYLTPLCPQEIARAQGVQAATDSNSQATATAAAANTQATATATLAKAQLDLENAKRAQDLADMTAAATALKGAGTSLKQQSTQLADVSAFSSAGQRFQADLANSTGHELAAELIEAMKSGRLEEGRIFVTSDQNVARQWMRSEDPAAVITDLRSQKKRLDDTVAELKACNSESEEPEEPPVIVREFSLTTGVVLGAAALEAIVNVGRAVGDALQPRITAASTVAAPASLADAIIAGAFSHPYGSATGDVLGRHLQMTTQPPTIAGDNPVVVAAKEAADSAVNAANALDQLKAIDPEKKVEKARAKLCLIEHSGAIESANAALKLMSDSNGDAVLGSRLARAVRAAAVSNADWVGIALLSQIAAGGAVATFQPRWPLSTRLVTAADLAIAFRVQDPQTGDLKTSGYISRACGRTLPIGDFAVSYKPGDCLADRKSENGGTARK